MSEMWQPTITITPQSMRDAREAAPPEPTLPMLATNVQLERALAEYNNQYGYPYRTFPSWLQTRHTLADVADQCAYCSQWRFLGQTLFSETPAEHIVCDGCLGRYYAACDSCQKISDQTSRVDGMMRCMECLRRDYIYCGCGQYRSHGTLCRCQSRAACCSPGERAFRIRNDGQPMLASDTRVTVTMPSSGKIDDEGISRIWRSLRDAGLYNAQSVLSSIDPVWQAKTGNFTRRLSSAAYKAGDRIPTDVLSAIGCIAQEHIAKSTALDIEITRQLDLPARAFAHEESCWFSTNETYARSRCAFKTNGGFGLRTFGEKRPQASSGCACEPCAAIRPDYSDVTGRAWVLPLVLHRGCLMPTTDTETPDAFMVFNGYGNLSGYEPARLLAHMMGWTYKKVGFLLNPAYINNESGYLLGAEDTISGVSAVHLTVDQHNDGDPWLTASADAQSDDDDDDDDTYDNDDRDW